MWLMVHDTLCVGSNISVMVTSLHPALPRICQSDLYDLYCQVLKVTLNTSAPKFSKPRVTVIATCVHYKSCSLVDGSKYSKQCHCYNRPVKAKSDYYTNMVSAMSAAELRQCSSTQTA